LYLTARATAPETFDRGVVLPSWCDFSDFELVRFRDTEEEIWNCVRVLGESLRRDAGFEMNPFAAGGDDIEAGLWVSEGRAVGVLVYVVGEGRFHWLDELADNPGTAPIHDDGRQALRITGVWVARQFRNRGIAKQLALAAGKEYGLDPERFIHTPPFTPEGRAFADSLAGGRVRVPVESRFY